MVKFKQNGDFSKVTEYLLKTNGAIKNSTLKKYGELGVEALSRATPIDTGLTAASWFYTIEKTQNGVKLVFRNSNIVDDWCSVAIMIQYGHATRNGGWVEGRDYINPAIQPIFDALADELYKEVTHK